MALESKPVFKGKVTLGTHTVLGVGTWSWSGESVGMLDDTSMGDVAGRYLPDIVEGGQLTFSGNYKKDDTTGQDALRSYMLNRAAITDIRLYVDASSYYTPNSTTGAGGGVPAGFPVSAVYVQDHSVDFSGPKGALGKVSFTLKVDGVMRLI